MKEQKKKIIGNREQNSGLFFRHKSIGTAIEQDTQTFLEIVVSL